MIEKRPWLQFYGDIPHTLEYPEITMYESVMRSVEKFSSNVVFDFFGRTMTYGDFSDEINRCADGLSSLGLKKGDRITISMPTTPQGIICFYAVNKLGAVASMIHPLSTESEIEFYCEISKSKFAFTIDLFYDKFKPLLKNGSLEKVILAKIPDYLPFFKATLFKIKMGSKIPKAEDKGVVWWNDLIKGKYPAASKAEMDTHDLAVILYSGGTTGKPKGIMLSNYNFISEGMMCCEWGKLDSSDSVLAILPIFHGFGLGVCINGGLMSGGKAVLVPTFTPEQVAKLIKQKRPTFIIGVPTLYEALNKNKIFQGADLSCLKAAFSGADTLPRVVKERFEEIVTRQNGSIKLLEGYGLTEAVTAIMATPMTEYREGSIGIPFPDMDAKVIKEGTLEEAEIGDEGELCVAGPAVMMGYLDQPEETDLVLKIHDDGKTWLHTGDIVSMDKDGFFYFKLRQKRMIKSSGMNVYPAQIEDHLYKHDSVAECCVIGVPDIDQVERVKAFVVLKKGFSQNEEMENELIDHCRKDLIKWSCPREVEFREEIPQTLVGKCAYKVLEDEEIARLQAEGKYTGNKETTVSSE